MDYKSLVGLTRKVLGEILECPICQESFDSSERLAKFLPCLHGFCAHCLQQHAGDRPLFPCPLCRRNTEVPAGGVAAFPDNFIANKLRELEPLLRADPGRPQGPACGACHAAEPAVRFCVDAACQNFLCQECVDQHGRLRIYEGHTTMTLEELHQQPSVPLPRNEPFCPKHKNQPFSLYCEEEDCQTILCLICSVTAHRNHKTIDLEEKCTQVRLELKSLAEDVSAKAEPVKELSFSTTTEINRTSGLFEERSSEMEAAFQDLVERLRARKDEVVAKMRQICRDRTALLKSLADEAELLLGQIATAVDFAEIACEVANPVDLLETCGQMTKRLGELRAVPVAGCVQADASFLTAAQEHRQTVRQILQLVPTLGSLRLSVRDRGPVPDVAVYFPDQKAAAETFAVNESHRVRLTIAPPPSETAEGLSETLHAYLSMPSGSTTRCGDIEGSGGVYDFHFRPLTVGQHTLSISLSGRPVRGSPFPVDVSDAQPTIPRAASAPSSKRKGLTSEATWSEAFAGCPHTVYLKLRGHSETDSLEASYTMSDSGSTINDTADIELILPSTSETAAGTSSSVTSQASTYKITCTPPLAGRLLMTIRVAGKPIDNPLSIPVSDLHPTSTAIIPVKMGACKPHTAVLNMPYTIILHSRKRDGTAATSGGNSVTATIRTERSGDDLQPDIIEDLKNGRYKIVFTPRCLIPYEVQIEVCGYPIREDPYLVTVSRCLVFPGPSGGYKSPKSMALDKIRKLVYVEDFTMEGIFCQASDGSSIQVTKVIECIGKPHLIAVSSAGGLITLSPDSRTVYVHDKSGLVLKSWACAGSNRDPATFTVTRADRVVIGDKRSRALFVYDLNGDPRARISLPEGALGPGMMNVSTDLDENIVVATHEKPYRFLSYTSRGNKISDLSSPAKAEQLALSVTDEDALIVASIGEVFILDTDTQTVVHTFQTNFLFTVLAADVDNTFAAFDPDKKMLVKYSYAKAKKENTYIVCDSN